MTSARVRGWPASGDACARAHVDVTTSAVAEIMANSARAVARCAWLSFMACSSMCERIVRKRFAFDMTRSASLNRRSGFLIPATSEQQQAIYRTCAECLYWMFRFLPIVLLQSVRHDTYR